MVERDFLTIMGMGGVFLLLGLATLLWGRGEEKSYYDAISARADVREYLDHRPQRPEPGALKVGGWITIAVGLLMLALGGGFWFWHFPG